MNSQIQKFKQLLNDSASILITSHISPDSDAVASLLMLGRTLKLNFTEKKVTMHLEEEPSDLSFLEGYSEIVFKPFYEELVESEPDLLLLLDGNNYERSSRLEGEKVRQLVQSKGLKTVVIDHHEPAGKDEVDVYINHGYPATVQDVYEILFNQLKLKKPTGFAQTAMLGLFADTGGFVYIKAGRHSEVFAFADELVTSGADIEQIKNLLSRYSEADMRALSELTANVSHEQDYSYSYLSDEFIEKWSSSGKSHAELQRPTGTFLDEFIRNIDGRKWGFITYKNLLEGPGTYSVSLRAVGDTKDVSLIAEKLGGGGHKPAAGGRFEAENVQDAIKKIKEAIRSAS